MRGSHQQRSTVLRRIQQVFRVGTVAGLSEDELLARGDELAFEALVQRHGPMVWGVCRRLLHDPNDAEDAFQATFLVLLRKAGTLRDPGGVGPWLHGVAHRVALRARSDAAFRREREGRAARPEAIEPDGNDDRDDLRNALDAEIRRLPERYQAAVVLCDLEGLTYEEAARRLDRTPAAIKGRLARARQRLRKRLTRQGFAPEAGWLAAGPFSRALPQPLEASTIDFLNRVSAGGSIAVASSAGVEALVQGVTRTMWISRVKLAAFSLSAVAGSAVIALACAFAFAQTGPDRAQPPESPKKTDRPDMVANSGQPGRVMSVRIVDARTGTPLSGVSLRVALDSQRQEFATDATGEHRLSLPGNVERTGFWITARKDGFVPTWINWGGMVDSVRFSLPGTLEIRLEPGTTIGGVIQDPEGRPIADALVWLTIDGGMLRDGVPRPVTSRDPVKTDAEGRWVYNAAPSNLDILRFRLEHPDHASETTFHKGPSSQELRKQTGVMVMQLGVMLSGRVLDTNDRPIAGATVRRGVFSAANSTPPATSDADGRFAFPHAEAGEVVLTVRAAGHAPTRRRFRLGSRTPSVLFHLAPGRTIRGRVLGPGGKPAAGASVGVLAWPEDAALGTWTKTNDEGRFQVADESMQEGVVRVHMPGFLTEDRPLKNADDQILFTLIPELTIRGAVLDAETGRPIDDFTLFVGDETRDEAERWDLDLSYHRHGGRYEAVFTWPAPAVRLLRIEAEGYLPAVSRGFRSNEGSVTYDFKLTRGRVPADPALSGVVHLPDGSPAAGAVVTLATKSRPVTLRDGRDSNPMQHPNATTAADGRFAFPHQAEPAIVLAIHEKGMARIDQEDLARTHEVTIRPWSRVEGTLRIGAKPGERQEITLYRGPLIGVRDSRVRNDWPVTTTDAEGHFVFEKVEPGEARVGRFLPSARGGGSGGPWVPINVAPGATAQVAIGGKGRPVVGRFVTPDDSGAIIDWSAPTVVVSLSLKPPQIQAPEGLTRPERAAWSKKWLLTDAGKTYLLERDRAVLAHYPVKVEPDGSFRIEDVIPGTYQWRMSSTTRIREERRAWSVAPASVSVPEIPGGRGEEPLNLGELKLNR